MTPRRRPEDLLEPLVGLVLAFTWASVGVRLLVVDDPALVRQVVAGLVLAVAGVGLGVALGSLLARRARRLGRTVPAADSESLGAAAVLLGPLSVGLGLAAADPGSIFATVGSALFCLGGGATTGIVLVATARRSALDASTSGRL